MIHPVSLEQKIGFDIVRYKIGEYCQCDIGLEYVKEMTFSSNFELLLKTLQETEEFRQILMFEMAFPSQDYYNLIPELSHLHLENSFIELESLPFLVSSLRTISNIIAFLQSEDNEKYLRLKSLTDDIAIDRSILIYINRIIDDRGEVRDDASPELLEVRKSLKKLSSSLDSKLNDVLKLVKNSGWSVENSEPTIRNGRIVIPIAATHKRKIQGFVHDESATGQTCYIEPIEVFDANNRIVELQAQERREIVKILIAFTSFIRPQIDELIKAYKFLGYIDFVRAKARFALAIKGVMPILVNYSKIEWYDFRHPLLYLTLKEKKQEIIPSTIILDKDSRILIISGPNAGGKSVALRSVGLIQYMLQCGITIPVRETSEVGIFTDMFIDIGDEQSIDNDMSTYSSHLLNMKTIVNHANDRSLFLIDEMGGGTEPQLGGAIAEAILEKLNARHAFGVITTHYGNLKMMSENNKGIVNGAMLFDMNKLAPLFKLKTGRPGSSFAFEIADKIGLNKEIIDKAKSKVGETRVNFEAQLHQLDIEKEAVEKQRKEFELADDLLKGLIEKYNTLNAKLEEQKKGIIEKAREEATRIVKGSNKLIESTIREIKEAQADKEKTKEIRKKFIQSVATDDYNSKEDSNVSKTAKKPIKPMSSAIPPSHPLQIGDWAIIKEQGVKGEIIDIKGDNVVVVFNAVKLSTTIDKIEKTTKNTTKSSKNNRTLKSDMYESKIQDFKLTLDIRGKRAEEAIEEVNKYIDDAMLLSIKEVKILHGKGNGILRSIVRQELHRNPDVKSFHSETMEFGGDGITIVLLK